jgi:phosphatidylglycerophosphate synthase
VTQASAETSRGHPQLTLKRLLTLEFSAGGHPLTRLMSQRIGAVCAWVGWRLGLSPNQLTLLAALVSVAGALVYGFAPTGPGGIVAALLLTQLGYGLDCADGQLARATRRTSALGRWLDVYLDMLTISSLAFAAVLRIAHQSPQLLGWAAVVALLYAHARVGNLFTCTLARSAGGGEAGRKSAAHIAFLVLIDTPMVLAGIVALGDWPVALLLYLALLAVLFNVHSVHVGTRTSAAR